MSPDTTLALLDASAPAPDWRRAIEDERRKIEVARLAIRERRVEEYFCAACGIPFGVVAVAARYADNDPGGEFLPAHYELVERRCDSGCVAGDDELLRTADEEAERRDW